MKTKLLPPSPAKLAAFLSLQKALSKPTTLVHHDPNKILWINLDASKEFGFGAVVFYTFPNEQLLKGKWPFKVLLAANSISIPPSHPSREKLLAHRAGNSGLCMGNTESPACCRVIEGKSHHPDRSHSYTQYTQPVLNNLHNFDNTNERLLSTRFTISLIIPPRCWTQARKKSHLT